MNPPTHRVEAVGSAILVMSVIALGAGAGAFAESNGAGGGADIVAMCIEQLDSDLALETFSFECTGEVEVVPCMARTAGRLVDQNILQPEDKEKLQKCLSDKFEAATEN